jgi:hypothetical protein
VNLPSLAKISDRTLGVVAIACVVAAVGVQQRQLYVALRDVHPIGDLAIFEFNVRLALEGLQRLGPYSQGFHHPGPAFFYLLAVPYVAMRERSYALYVCAYFLAVTFIVGIAVAVCRWTENRVAALVVGPLVVLECAYLGDYPLFDYWPPYVLFLGYACFLVLGAGIAAGRVSALLPFFCIGSLLVQTHIGYALPVLGAIVVAGGYLFRSRPLDPGTRRRLVSAAAAVAILWTPPIYSDLFGETRNVHDIVHTFARGAHAPWKVRGLLDRVALEFTGPFQFGLFGDRFIVPEAPKHFMAARLLFVVELWLLVLGRRHAGARGDRFLEALCSVCLVSIPVSVLAIHRIGVTGAPHHTAWISALGMVSAIAGCAAVAPSRWLGRTAARPVLRTAGLAIFLLLVCSVQPISIIPENHSNPEVSSLASKVEETLRSTPHLPVTIDSMEYGEHAQGRSPAFEIAVGLMLELEKRGRRFSMRDVRALRWALGRSRWVPLVQDAPVVTVTAGHTSSEGRRLMCVDETGNFFVPSPVCLWLGA